MRSEPAWVDNEIHETIQLQIKLPLWGAWISVGKKGHVHVWEKEPRWHPTQAHWYRAHSKRALLYKLSPDAVRRSDTVKCMCVYEYLYNHPELRSIEYRD